MVSFLVLTELRKEIALLRVMFSFFYMEKYCHYFCHKNLSFRDASRNFSVQKKFLEIGHFYKHFTEDMKERPCMEKFWIFFS